MKRIAASALIAGGLFLGAFGAAGAAQATELQIGPDGVGITAVDGSGVAMGPEGVKVWLPDAANNYDGRYYDGRFYDRYDHPRYQHPYSGCYSAYCGR